MKVPEDLTYNIRSVRDRFAFDQIYDALWQAVFNGAAVYSKAYSGFDQAELWVGLRVPDGRVMVLYDRIVSVRNGNFRVDIYAGDWTGGEAFSINTLRTSAVTSVTSDAMVNVTPSGTPILVEEGLVSSGVDQGNISAVTALEEQRTVKIIEGPASAMLKLTRLSSEPYDVALSYTVWEMGSIV